MDLSNLNLPGELPEPIVTCTIEGIMDEGDLRLLTAKSEVGVSIPQEEEDPANLKKIREKHHSVARLIASAGMPQRMVAQLCGYTESYLSILINNPAMQNLIEMYRVQNGSAAAIISENLKTVGLKAVEKLHEKLDSEDGLNNQELLQLAKLGLDRGGFGPQSKHTIHQENHVIDHAKLAELNDTARSRSKAYIVPVEEVRKALPAPQEPKDDQVG